MYIYIYMLMSQVSIASIRATSARGRVLLRVSPNSFPCTKVSVRKEPGDDGLVEFVQVCAPS